MAMIGKKPTPDPMAPISPELLAAGSQPLSSDQAMPAMPNIPPAHHGVNWLGVFGDAMLGAAGKPGIYGPMMAERQNAQTAFERGEQQYRTHRRDNNDDWMQRQIYEDTHKTDALTEAMRAGGIDPKSPQGISLYGQRANTIANPVQFMTGPDGAIVPGYKGGSPAPSGPPPGAVAYLKANPSQAGAFDQKYGAGASSSYLGGPGSQAPATFR